MNRYRSPLAHFVSNPRNVRNRPNPKPFGLLVHTTGRGILKRARQLGISPLEAAMEFYTTRGNPFAHYILDQDGTLIQIADEREQAWHAGIPAAQRRLYLSGRWEKMVSKRALERWLERWNLGYYKQSPSHLYPTKSPNQCYVGIELIPDKRATFSDKQYASLSLLINDFWDRHNLPPLGCRLPEPRCLGHEDAEPLERFTRQGGYDPGSLRAKPKFDWSKL